MRRATVFIAAAFLFINLPCSAQREHGSTPTSSGGVLPSEQAAYDVLFYDIDISVLPDRQEISGAVTVHVKFLDSSQTLLLDLDGRMDVSQIDLSSPERVDAEAEFEREDGRIRIMRAERFGAGEVVQARIIYSGAPRIAPNPPWVGGFTWETTSDGSPWIATSVQMDGADLWIPVKDHPSDKSDSVSIRITVPDGLTVASNGVLRDVTEARDSTTFHWFTGLPINNYSIALNIAPYEQIESEYTSVDGMDVPVSMWLLPERVEAGERMLPQFIDHVKWFEKLLGPYPFRAEKYGIAHTPHLGMEHQTIIAYGSTFSNNEWGFDWLHHHELAHEWWANLVTASDWKDFWIHEGFGTYMQALYVEHLHGREAYLTEMQATRGNISNLKPVAPREPRSTTEMYFVEGAATSDGDIYYKGSWTLHTLRHLIGDDHFFTSLRLFAYPDEEARTATDGSQVRFVTTQDYIDLVEELSGRELEWFFDLYLRQPDLPRLVSERSRSHVELRWDTPNDLPFPMPVDVVIDGQSRRVEMEGGQATIAAPEGVDVHVDPAGWVLKQ